MERAISPPGASPTPTISPPRPARLRSATTMDAASRGPSAPAETALPIPARSPARVLPARQTEHSSDPARRRPEATSRSRVRIILPPGFLPANAEARSDTYERCQLRLTGPQLAACL